MNRILKTLALTGFLAVAASAQLGVGYDRSLAGNEGLGINYRLQNSMNLELILRLNNTDSLTYCLTARGFYPLTTTGNLSTSVGLGVNYSGKKGSYIDESNVGTVSEPDKAVIVAEVPLRVEYYILPNLSVHTAVGLRAGVSGDKTWGTSGELLGNAGVTVWFKMDSNSKAKHEKKSKKAKAAKTEAVAPVIPAVPAAPAPAAVSEEEEDDEGDDDSEEDDEEEEE